MEQQLKERLIGVTVLVIAAIIFIPIFFTKSTDLAQKEVEDTLDSRESGFVSKLKPMTKTATGRSDTEEPPQITEEPPQITEEPPNPNKVPETTEMGQMNWIVQIGSFSSKDNAEKLNQKVKKAGFRSFVNPIIVGEKTMHQVCLGPEYDMAAANELSKEIKNKMKLNGIVKKYP